MALPRSSGRKFIRRRIGVAKQAMWKKPTARNQRKQIYSNAKSIGRLNARWAKMTVKHSYSEYGLVNLYSSDASGQAYQFIPLMNPQTWTQIFAETNVPVTNKTLVNSMTIMFRFNVATQPAPVVYHLFIVSCKRSAGTLDIDKLTNGDHYETTPATSAQGMQNVMLNPKCFKIHRHRKFTLSVNSAGDQIAAKTDGFPPCSWKDIKYQLYPKMTLRNYDGDWKSMDELDLPPSQRYYALVFFNSSFAANYYNTVTYNNVWQTRNMY